MWIRAAGARAISIRPVGAWLSPANGEMGWSWASEQLHGIALDTLMRDGMPHADVARRAAAALTGPGVMTFSDAPDFGGQ